MLRGRFLFTSGAACGEIVHPVADITHGSKDGVRAAANLITGLRDFNEPVEQPEKFTIPRGVPELRQGRSHGEQGIAIGRGVANGRVLPSQYDGRGQIRTGPWNGPRRFPSFSQVGHADSTSRPATFLLFFLTFCSSHSMENVFLNALLIND